MTVVQQKMINQLLQERGYGAALPVDVHIETSWLKLAEEVMELGVVLGFPGTAPAADYYKQLFQSVIHDDASPDEHWRRKDVVENWVGDVHSELADVAVTLTDVECAVRRRYFPNDETVDVLALAARKAAGDVKRGVT